MHKTQAKIDNMSTADWHQYHQLLANEQLMAYFNQEILRFSYTLSKPDDVLRRFSLNGDGQLDLKEFQLAVKRLGILPVRDGSMAEEQEITRRSKELYGVICPNPSRKLDIDMFCRIMNDWSLQIMRNQQQQQQLQGGSATPRGYMYAPTSATNTAPNSSSSSNNGLPTPYATEHSAMKTSSGRTIGESEVIWRRLADAIASNMDKLSHLFFKMDITCCASVSREEFELALSHIGVFLTPREYDRFYDTLAPELKALSSSSNDHSTDGSLGAFGIKYADFLALFRSSHKASTALPSGCSMTSPPVAAVGSARLWDFLITSLERLEPLFQQYVRINQHALSPDSFRNCLLRCGLAMSTADYAALRVRLLPFTESNGQIALAPLLEALKACDRTAKAPGAASAAILKSSSSAGNGVRTGRKTVFTNEDLLHPDHNHTSSMASGSSAAPHTYPAGKSNEQRNAEANRTIVKIRDESRWKSDAILSPKAGATDQSGGAASVQSNAADGGLTQQQPTGAPRPLEQRILIKLQQARELGQLGACSPQSLFPGDRFNRITRGQFRQSLAQLGVLARYAEVESLFWSLDPQGRGYINKHDFYDHLNMHVNSAAASSTSAALLSLDVPAWNLPALGGSPRQSPSDSPSSINYSTVHAHRPGTLARSVQKVLEGMLIHLPLLLSICSRMDPQQSGFLSNSDFLIAIQETGVLASRADLQTAVAALMQCSVVPSATPRGMIPYRDMEKGLGRLCSDLLSPKKRRKHLSTTSVLLAPHEQPRDDLVQHQPEYNMNLVSENGTDALWDCPRRRMNHDHPATKSSFRISDQLAGLQLSPDDDLSYMPSPAHPGLSGGAGGGSNATMLAADETTGERKQRMNRLALISVLQDLLERRGELKTVMDLHRHADVHGQVTKDDLIEILRTSRLNLNFASVSVHEFVDELYPQLKSTSSGSVGVGFLDLLHRINDLLADLSRATPPAATGGWQGGSNGQQQNQQQHRRQKAHTPSYDSPYRYHHAPQQPQQPRTARAMSSFFSGGHFYSDETSVQRKLLGESRLQDLLESDQGRRSAAILIRHAFKGVAARELVVPTDTGEYEAICRASDLKHVCYRLGLDLEPSELQFLVQSIDVNASGFVSSHQLLQFFMHLAATPKPVPSTLTANCSSSCSPRQLQGQVHPHASSTPDQRYRSPRDPANCDAYNKQRKSPPVQAG